MRLSLFAVVLGTQWTSVMLGGDSSNNGPRASCCQKISDTKIPVNQVSKYVLQDTALCAIKAVRFTTQKNKIICSDPESQWAKRATGAVDKRNSNGGSESHSSSFTPAGHTMFTSTPPTASSTAHLKVAEGPSELLTTPSKLPTTPPEPPTITPPEPPTTTPPEPPTITPSQAPTTTPSQAPTTTPSEPPMTTSSEPPTTTPSEPPTTTSSQLPVTTPSNPPSTTTPLTPLKLPATPSGPSTTTPSEPNRDKGSERHCSTFKPAGQTVLPSTIRPRSPTTALPNPSITESWNGRSLVHKEEKYTSSSTMHEESTNSNIFCVKRTETTRTSFCIRPSL